MTCLCQKNKHITLSLCLKRTPSVLSIVDFFVTVQHFRQTFTNQQQASFMRHKWPQMSECWNNGLIWGNDGRCRLSELDCGEWGPKGGGGGSPSESLPLLRAVARPTSIFSVCCPHSGLQCSANTTGMNWGGPSVLTDKRTHSRAKGLSLQHPNDFPSVWWCFSLKWNASPTGPIPLKWMID